MTSIDPADLTTSQLDADIRAAAAEVYVRAQTWRDSPLWRGARADRLGYVTVVLAIADLDSVSKPADHAGLWRLVQAVAPILNHGWPVGTGSGPAGDLAEAVEVLRETAVTRLREAEQARRRAGRR